MARHLDHKPMPWSCPVGVAGLPAVVIEGLIANARAKVAVYAGRSCRSPRREPRISAGRAKGGGVQGQMEHNTNTSIQLRQPCHKRVIRFESRSEEHTSELQS